MGGAPIGAVAHEHDCPHCGAEVTKPDRAGDGILFPKPRYLRLVKGADGHDHSMVGCQGCGSELEVKLGRLLLIRRGPLRLPAL